MNAQGSLLAQLRPSGTSATLAFTSPPNVSGRGLQTEITLIAVCNTTGAPASFSIYHHDTGTTYDQTTALYYGVALAANTTDLITIQSPNSGIMMRPGGKLAVQTSVANALTFSIYGVTQQRPIAQ